MSSSQLTFSLVLCLILTAMSALTREPQCPTPLAEERMGGECNPVELCGGNVVSDCSEGLSCCSNGCGHVCLAKTTLTCKVCHHCTSEELDASPEVFCEEGTLCQKLTHRNGRKTFDCASKCRGGMMRFNETSEFSVKCCISLQDEVCGREVGMNDDVSVLSVSLILLFSALLLQMNDTAAVTAFL